MATTYVVTVGKPGAEFIGEHLLTGKNQAQVRNYLGELWIKVRVATPQDVQRLVKAGTEIIDVNAPAEVASAPGAQ